jgi:hypothetical protein
MYEDRYDLSGPELQQAQEILAEMSVRGGRLTDSAGRPIAYRVLRGRRWLICDKGLIWRYAPEGSPQSPAVRGGPVRRNSAIEMWTGRWRKVSGPDGKVAYAKQIVWVPMDNHVNGHAGISKLGWYRTEKGFAHPFDSPEAPSPEQIAELEGLRAQADQAVYARMMVEGLSAPQPDAAKPADLPQRQPAPAAPAKTAAQKGRRHAS